MEDGLIAAHAGGHKPSDHLLDGLRISTHSGWSFWFRVEDVLRLLPACDVEACEDTGEASAEQDSVGSCDLDVHGAGCECPQEGTDEEDAACDD